jgi:hypothetical protein
MQRRNAGIDQALALAAVGERARGAGAWGFFLRAIFSSHRFTLGKPARPMSERSDWLKKHGKWFIILPPLLYLLVFFLIPFAFALKISFADTACTCPRSPIFYP